MKMRRFAAGLSATALALTFAGCGSDSEDSPKSASGDSVKTISSGTLTVCSDVPYPPFEDFDKSTPTGFKGFDIDIVTEVAQALDLKLKVQDSSFDALQSGLALNSSQCDMAASAMTITPARAKKIDFSESYYDSEQSLLVPEGSSIKSIDDLTGKKVGVQKGTTGETYTNENAKGAKVVVFPSDGEMWPALQSGQVDALLQDLPVNVEHEKTGGFVIVEKYSTDEAYGLAMKKGSPLVAKVDEALAELRSSGRYDEIYSTYFTATN